MLVHFEISELALKTLIISQPFKILQLLKILRDKTNLLSPQSSLQGDTILAIVWMPIRHRFYGKVLNAKQQPYCLYRPTWVLSQGDLQSGDGYSVISQTQGFNPPALTSPQFISLRSWPSFLHYNPLNPSPTDNFRYTVNILTPCRSSYRIHTY